MNISLTVATTCKDGRETAVAREDYIKLAIKSLALWESESERARNYEEKTKHNDDQCLLTHCTGMPINV